MWTITELMTLYAQFGIRVMQIYMPISLPCRLYIRNNKKYILLYFEGNNIKIVSILLL